MNKILLRILNKILFRNQMNKNRFRNQMIKNRSRNQTIRTPLRKQMIKRIKMKHHKRIQIKMNLTRNKIRRAKIRINRLIMIIISKIVIIIRKSRSVKMIKN